MASTIALGLAIDRTDKRTLDRQIAHQIRALILQGALPAGAALPSSRMLAVDIGCSRMPVATAYDQLTAEGLVIAAARSGYHVAAVDGLATVQNHDNDVAPALSERGANLAEMSNRSGAVRNARKPGRGQLSLRPVLEAPP